MSLDRTEQQSSKELRKARDLSLEPTRPPAEVPGYKLLKFLGSGAYGEVWSAQDLKTRRYVAVKFYTRRTSTDIQLLAQEVEKLAVLAADRYVVQLLDVGWDASPPYYVMDYVENGSLEDRLREDSPIPVGEAIELFQEIANGMMHLHGKGILHCDLKPGNVLLDQDGKPRLADFGQSRLTTEQTAALGTLFYMAPEQADLNAVPDTGWDVYGLGALLFSMLTGKPPYYSPQLANEIESVADIEQRLATYRSAIMNAPLPREHRSVRGVDRPMAEIIDRCIAADPKKRFPNVQSLLHALRQREIANARRPLMLLGFLGPLLLIGVMAVFGWWAFRQSVDQTQEAIKQKSVESNQFAAQLAARSAAEQIDEYFRVVRQLSKDPAYLKKFQRVIEDPELSSLREQLADPAQNAFGSTPSGSPLDQVRFRFRDHPLRKTLQPALEKRLFDQSGDFPLASSWFVCDRWGNQIASAFRTENKTLGNNFAYRTYFTGLVQDLKKVENGQVVYGVSPKLEERTIIDHPHLSAVFISKQSNGWKVAFSAPIVIDGKVEGIVAATVELGHFIEFDNISDHYAMMVDMRAGENYGIILEHPLFQKMLQEKKRIPDELLNCRLTIADLKASDSFFDPVGATSSGEADGYGRRAIVARADVTMEQKQTPSEQAPSPPQQSPDESDAQAKPGDSSAPAKARTSTGLIVLAVEDLASIVRPADQLSRKLGMLAFLAILSLVAMSVGMWLFVTRMMRESRERLERSFSPSSTSSLSSPMVSQETIALSDERGASSTGAD